MKYTIHTNTFITSRLPLIMLCIMGLAACVSAPELYSNKNPLQAQTRDLNDVDLDGVINERDLCSETPNDAVINNDGCEKLTGRPKVKFREVNFSFDKSDLNTYEHNRVVEIAFFLNKYPETSLYLIGDTSIEGSDAYNEKLAQRRIKTVHTLLIKNKVAASRLKKESFSVRNHIPESLKGRKTRLIAVLKWPEDYKDYEVEWNIFTESQKITKNIK
jgi:OOP family OmpA-OmpF porin